MRCFGNHIFHASYKQAVKDTKELRDAVETVQPERVKLALRLGQSQALYKGFQACDGLELHVKLQPWPRSGRQHGNKLHVSRLIRSVGMSARGQVSMTGPPSTC